MSQSEDFGTVEFPKKGLVVSKYAYVNVGLPSGTNMNVFHEVLERRTNVPVCRLYWR